MEALLHEVKINICEMSGLHTIFIFMNTFYLALYFYFINVFFTIYIYSESMSVRGASIFIFLILTHVQKFA